MSKNRRPQAPKRRNFVKKHMDDFQRPEVHRDRTKYDRIEDRWQDQLDDYLAGMDDDYGDLDEEDDRRRRKEEFQARLKSKDYDPDLYNTYQEWQKHQDWMDENFTDIIPPQKGELYMEKKSGVIFVFDGEKFILPEK